MADLSKLIKTDPERETGGVWFDFLADIRIKIARIDNPNYRRAERQIGRDLQAMIQAGGDFVEQASDERSYRLAASMITDWENLEDEGDIVPFSPEAALRLIKKYNTLFSFVCFKGALLEPYRFATDGAGRGNSETLSTGSESGERKSDGLHESA